MQFKLFIITPTCMCVLNFDQSASNYTLVNNVYSIGCLLDHVFSTTCTYNTVSIPCLF